jgi:hypothetical protein
MKKKIVIPLLGTLVQAQAHAIEEPQYQEEVKYKEFMIRSYASMLVAQTEVDTSFEAAGNMAFRILAEYIFGKNSSKEKIAMTAPVTQSESESEKIAMTAPVIIEDAKLQDKNSNKQWTVSFLMPAGSTLDNLPKPLDPLVKIREVPSEKRAAIIFSGFYNEEKVEDKTQALREWMKSKNMKPTGEAQFARYNPPWSLPFMRRNEILIQVLD